MTKVHIVDGSGFYVETQNLPDGIEVLGSITAELPVAPVAPGKAWRWVGDSWIQDDEPDFVPVTDHQKYTQDEWVVKNGFTGYKILAAAKADSLAQFFYESMKAAPYVTTADPRLGIAYGYFVGAGYITSAEANSVCGFEVEPLTAEQVAEKMGAV